MDLLKVVIILSCLAIGAASCSPDPKRTEPKQDKYPFPEEPDPGQQQG